MCPSLYRSQFSWICTSIYRHNEISWDLFSPIKTQAGTSPSFLPLPPTQTKVYHMFRSTDKPTFLSLAHGQRIVPKHTICTCFILGLRCICQLYGPIFLVKLTALLSGFLCDMRTDYHITQCPTQTYYFIFNSSNEYKLLFLFLGGEGNWWEGAIYRFLMRAAIYTLLFKTGLGAAPGWKINAVIVGILYIDIVIIRHNWFRGVYGWGQPRVTLAAEWLYFSKWTIYFRWPIFPFRPNE